MTPRHAGHGARRAHRAPRAPARLAPDLSVARGVRPALLFLALLASSPLAGCHEPTPLPRDAAFEVGTGVAAFEPLTADTAVPINYGLQGGSHLWFAARCKGLGAETTLTYSIEDTHGDVVSDESEIQLPSEPDADGWRTITGLTALIDDVIPEGTRVIFRGHLEDEEGHEMDASGKAVVKGEAEAY